MKSRKAFTLMELLVVIAIIVILAALLLPVLGKSKQKAWQSTCQNNIRQLQLGWIMYANDFGDSLPHNSAGAGAGESLQNPGWVAGDMWLNSDVVRISPKALIPSCWSEIILLRLVPSAAMSKIRRSIIVPPTQAR